MLLALVIEPFLMLLLIRFTMNFSDTPGASFINIGDGPTGVSITNCAQNIQNFNPGSYSRTSITAKQSSLITISGNTWPIPAQHPEAQFNIDGQNISFNQFQALSVVAGREKQSSTPSIFWEPVISLTSGGVAGKPTTFMVMGCSNEAVISWNLEDGKPYSGVSVGRIFNNLGMHTVKLTATINGQTYSAKLSFVNLAA